MEISKISRVILKRSCVVGTMYSLKGGSLFDTANQEKASVNKNISFHSFYLQYFPKICTYLQEKIHFQGVSKE